MLRNKAQWLAAASIIIESIACAEKSTAPDVVVTQLEAATSRSITGIAGAPVAERPSVLVRDQNGAPVPGFHVTFRASEGNGTVTGAEAETNKNGIATVGEWVLGKTMGFNQVIAKHGFLSIEFRADGVAGPAAVIVKMSGDNQYVLPSSSLQAPAVVSVRDANDNPVAGALVDFSVISGGGSLSSAGTVTSDEEGLARFDGWIVGEAGLQSLRATVAGAPPVVFAAIATRDPCLALLDISSGALTTLSLSEASCLLDNGQRGISFALHVPTLRVYELSQASLGFESRVLLSTKGGEPVAEVDGGNSSGFATLTTLLAPGDYIVTTVSLKAGDAGSFTLSSKILAQPLSGCRDVFLLSNVSTNQTIGAEDCPGPQIGSREDHYRVFLKAGTTAKITMAATDNDTRLEIYGPDNDLLASAEENVSYLNYDSHLGFKVPKSGYYLIKAMCLYGYGPYAMIID
jgi:hypothetical protein